MKRAAFISLALALIVAAWLDADVPSATAASQVKCPNRINHSYATKAEQKHAVSVGKPPITLEPTQNEPVINFGSRREKLPDFIVFKASRPIPKSVKWTSFEIDSLEPMRRVGEGGLETEHLNLPSYSRPRFFNHRKYVAFNLCVNGLEGDPGVYTGQFLFSGPAGMPPKTIVQTAQLKLSGSKFGFWLAVALLVTLVFLWIRTYSQFEDKHGKKERRVRIAVMVIPVFAAGAAMYLVYDGSPTWGTDLPLSVAALIGTAFTAAGLGSSISNGTERLSGIWNEGKAPKDTTGGSSGSGGDPSDPDGGSPGPDDGSPSGPSDSSSKTAQAVADTTTAAPVPVQAAPTPDPQPQPAVLVVIRPTDPTTPCCQASTEPASQAQSSATTAAPASSQTTTTLPADTPPTEPQTATAEDPPQTSAATPVEIPTTPSSQQSQSTPLETPAQPSQSTPTEDV
jgi:hypothetical protein